MAFWGVLLVVNWTAAPASADLLAQAGSCNAQSVLQPCINDTERGVDTPFGPLATASVIDEISAPPIFGYLGQATAQAGFGHVETAAELQVSSLFPFPEDGIGATATANSSDIGSAAVQPCNSVSPCMFRRSTYAD
jgi:hypothetical protein